MALKSKKIIQTRNIYRVKRSFVTTRPFSLKNNLVCDSVAWFPGPAMLRVTRHSGSQGTRLADSVEIGQITSIIKSHDKSMTALCVCCSETKSKFYSLKLNTIHKCFLSV